MRKKLILGVTAVALAVPAPAFGIHHLVVPAGDCAASGSQAVGLPAPGAGNPDRPDVGFVNTGVLSQHADALAHADQHCHH
jgi:hypothetical protein